VSTTLYASNLPLSATEATLAVKFGKFGAVISVRLHRDATTGVSRRRAFVEMDTAEAAERAVAALNFAELDGRLMSVYKAVIGVEPEA
jgi:RNA recognition motif-containing protein